MKRCSSQKIFLRGLINHACAFFIFFFKKTKKRNPTPTKSMCKSMYIEIVHFFYFCIYVIYIVILKKIQSRFKADSIIFGCNCCHSDKMPLV